MKKTLNEVLRKMRLDQNISQAELARRSGISKQMISKMEIPGNNFTIDILSKYCAALNIDINFSFKERTKDEV